MNRQIKPGSQKITTYSHINLHVQGNKESETWQESQEIIQSFHLPLAGHSILLCTNHIDLELVTHFLIYS